MEEDSLNPANLDTSLRGRMVLTAELKTTKSSLAQLCSCSRQFKTVWRGRGNSVLCGSIHPVCKLVRSSAGGRLETVNDDETSVSKHFITTAVSATGW